LPPWLRLWLQGKNKKKKQYLLDIQSPRQKSCNNPRRPGTVELRSKAILSVLDAAFGCFVTN